MTKVKYLVLLLVSAMLLLVPNISNAATEYTYEDTEQGITWTYELDKNENVINLRCTTTTIIGAVNIPSTIDGKTVISLSGNYSKGAFKGITGITEITIPNTIVRIGDHAFDGCTGIKTVVIPDCVTSIGDSAFDGCSALTSVKLPNKLSQIGASAFRGCAGLKSITIPDSVSDIQSAAFMNCSGLRTIIIPDSVTTIGSSAFENCTGLRELNLSKNLSKIEQSTFENCSSLKSVIIPDSVTTIGGWDSLIYGAFQDCVNLEKVLIPDSVTTIAGTAFKDCKKLTIYGNDDQASKDYAEANEIPFDYIANWDKEESGKDITAPTLENLMITYESVMKYKKDANTNMYIVPADAKIVINAIFSEQIKGTTVPTLTIKFGEGKNIEVTEGTISGSEIVYIYTIKNTDKGVMASVSFIGGNVTDEAGNVAILSCPKMWIQYDSVDKIDVVYANGTATNPDAGSGNNGTNNGTGTTTEKEENKNEITTGKEENKNETITGKEENNNTTQKEETKNDSTKAPGKIPHAGAEMGIIVAIITTIIIGMVVYSRYNKIRDI